MDFGPASQIARGALLSELMVGSAGGAFEISIQHTPLREGEVRSSLRILIERGRARGRASGGVLPRCRSTPAKRLVLFGGVIEIEGTGGSFPVRARIGLLGRSRPMAETREVCVAWLG